MPKERLWRICWSIDGAGLVVGQVQEQTVRMGGRFRKEKCRR